MCVLRRLFFYDVIYFTSTLETKGDVPITFLNVKVSFLPQKNCYYVLITNKATLVIFILVMSRINEK